MHACRGSAARMRYAAFDVLSLERHVVQKVSRMRLMACNTTSTHDIPNLYSATPRYQDEPRASRGNKHDVVFHPKDVFDI